MLISNNNENNKIHHNHQRRRRTKNHKKRWEGVIFICTIFIFSIWFIAITILVSKLEENIQTNDPHQMSSNFMLGHENNLYMHPQHSLPKYPMNHRQNLIKSSSSSQHRRPLTDQAISQCNKALWHTLQTTVYVLPHNETFVISGDIQDLW